MKSAKWKMEIAKVRGQGKKIVDRILNIERPSNVRPEREKAVAVAGGSSMKSKGICQGEIED